MTDKQENKRTMARAVLACLEKFESLVATLPAFAKAKTDLSNNLATIDSREEVQKRNRTGVRKDKDVAKRLAIRAVVKACKRARNYATDADNNTLDNEVNYSVSMLGNLRDTALTTKLTELLKTLQSVLDKLADYGVTSETTVDIAARIGTYDNLVSVPREGTNEQSTATKAMAKEFVKMMANIKKIERFADGFNEENEDFVNMLHSAMVIIDSGIRHRKDEDDTDGNAGDDDDDEGEDGGTRGDTKQD